MKLFRSYYRRKVTQICVYIVKLTSMKRILSFYRYFLFF